MAKSKRPPAKSSASTADIEARLQESLFDRKPAQAAPREEPPPSVGDRVTYSQSDTVYTISRVSPSGTQVDLRLEGTNIERFRVPVADLDFVDRRTPRQSPPKPAKPAKTPTTKAPKTQPGKGAANAPQPVATGAKNGPYVGTP